MCTVSSRKVTDRGEGEQRTDAGAALIVFRRGGGQPRRRGSGEENTLSKDK